MSDQTLITVAHLSKRFNDFQAVSDVSFTLDTGEVFGILGPNGAGKTTTIKMTVGLITPTSGSARVMGYDTAVESQRLKANQHLGVLLEGARNIYWRLSPLENLRFFGANRGVPRQVIDSKAGELFALLDLEEHAHKMVAQFSQGMKQKVALANALIHDPDILILDEPTLGLDVESAQKIEETIVRFVKRGKGVLLTTHMMRMAEKLCSKLLVIHEGQEVAHDETQSLLARFDTRKIIEAKVRNQVTPADLNAISDAFPSIVTEREQTSTVLQLIEPTQEQTLNLLTLLNGMNYQILSVNQREPSLEEIFLSLTTTRSKGQKDGALPNSYSG